ncbi:hypothetical protein [Staphylococcus argenteus]|uniref:hypothetical protein n=1 Tax=Staphylococcus argenteus TaxID=985002 RepID=UPI0028663D44|nr:hypothetical protein [Staphylococcus argenteus]MDR7640751.1 hypothetical protein [Staphylococcus argenteus]
MYRYISKDIEQQGFQIIDVIHLFEKVDQNRGTQDDIDEIDILSRNIYYLCQRQLKLEQRLQQIANIPLELMEWFVFESYDRGVA